MARLPPAYAQVLAESRRRLQRYATGAALQPLKRLYERAEADLLAKLARRSATATPFTAAHMSTMLAQVRQGQAVIAHRMAGGLGDISKQAQRDSLQGLTKGLRQLEKHHTGTTPVLPIDEAARFTRVIDKRQSSLLRMHERSFRRYGARLVGEMEDEMALAMVTGQTVGQAIDRLQEVAGNEWWQAERIGRTETLFAYNATHADGIRALAPAVPDLMQRWTEHVSDSGEPLDDRVGEDSIVLHGQVAPPGGLFTMPPDPKVSKSLWNQQWPHPPDRPHDRAVLVPWKRTWGVPGWQWTGGQKVWLVRP